MSVCHSLRFFPHENIRRFSSYLSEVIMITVGHEYESMAVPGSLKVSDAADDGTHTKKITFSVAPCNEKIMQNLQLLSAMRLVAVYVDENGRERVCGSPSLPLKLSYTYEGGGCAVTLEGHDVAPNPYLRAL